MLMLYITKGGGGDCLSVGPGGGGHSACQSQRSSAFSAPTPSLFFSGTSPCPSPSCFQSEKNNVRLCLKLVFVGKRSWLEKTENYLLLLFYYHPTLFFTSQASFSYSVQLEEDKKTMWCVFIERIQLFGKKNVSIAVKRGNYIILIYIFIFQ